MTVEINLRNDDAVFEYLRSELNSFVDIIQQGAELLDNFEESAFEIIESDLKSTVAFMFAVDGDVAEAEIDAMCKVSDVLSYLTGSEPIGRAVHKIMLNKIAKGEFQDLRFVAVQPRCVNCAAVYDITYGTQHSLQVARFYYNFLLSAANVDGVISADEKLLLSEIHKYLFEELPATLSEDESVEDKNIELDEPKVAESISNSLNPRGELENLIGLKSVKEIISTLVNKVQINKVREEKGLPKVEMSLHMVFTGNPGTGKTTVARLVGAILKELGALEKGHLIEVDRASLVAGYVGQTAIKTTTVIKAAIGGVLFVDEAYALTAGNDSYGDEAINTLLKGMEDNRTNLVVIVAGYTNEMEKFVNSNPGLRSRFDHFVEFPDYSVSELTDIFTEICNSVNMRVSDDGLVAFQDVIKSLHGEGSLKNGNARFVRKFFQAAASAQANRLAMLSNFTDYDLQTLTAGDINLAKQKAF